MMLCSNALVQVPTGFNTHNNLFVALTLETNDYCEIIWPNQNLQTKMKQYKTQDQNQA